MYFNLLKHIHTYLKKKFINLLYPIITYPIRIPILGNKQYLGIETLFCKPEWGIRNFMK